MALSETPKQTGDNPPVSDRNNLDDKAALRAVRQAANRAEREALRQERQAIRQQEREARRASRVTGKELPSGARGRAGGEPAAFNILVIAQKGRLAREALLFAASLRRNAPDWRGRLIIAEPRAEGAWAGADVALTDAERAALAAFGAEITPFTAQHFGQSYPHGNKIEALSVLPAGAPFVFFDSDTIVTGALDRVPFDFSRPSASMRRTGTWPEPPLYGPDFNAIWKSLYDRFGLDFASTLDLSQPDNHWERYLYFNAGWFFGADPHEFGRRMLDWALQIREMPGDALACQSLDPWLDQIVLPLVVHSLGGGRPGPELSGLDGEASCHYRNLSLLYAREADATVALVEELLADPRIAPVCAEDDAVIRLVLGGEGRGTIRSMFDPASNPPEQPVRHQLKRAGLWFR